MNKSRILIVDDEEDIRSLLSEFLDSIGYKVKTAKNASEALDLFKSRKDIGLIMSDIRMPGRTGLDLLSDIKQINEDVIFIMISAVKDIEFAISAMSKGAYDYVSKPFKLAQVKLVIEKGLEKRRLILENREYQKSLEKKVKERTRELQFALERLDKTYKNTLQALATALDMRDEETQGHSLRVLHYSSKIAKLMGIKDKEEIKNLEYGALLHDIGKIGIPDSILRKPSQLNSKEWKIMKKHPEIGYKILRDIDFLRDASGIVLHHHENFDGSGYPEGLKGEEIPLGARIFAVADAVDAMTSKRLYRETLTFKEAAKELKKYKGVRFDPKVIDAFFKKDLKKWEKESAEIKKSFKNNPLDIQSNDFF